MKTIFILFALLVSITSHARGRSKEYNIYDTPFSCSNGRTYQWHGRVMYVDGIPARNGITYEIHCSPGDPRCSLWESSFHTADCYSQNPPPPPEPIKHWDNYVKVCNGRQQCHYESRQID